jgi:hypothetical protein
MPDAAPTEPRKKTYEGASDSDAAREAAKDLSEAREQGRVPQAEAEAEPIDRSYKWSSGDKEGQDVEKHFTLDAERAARELTAIRKLEADVANPTNKDKLAASVDVMRAAFPGRELPPDIVQQIEQNYAAQQQPDQTQAAEPPPQVEQPQTEPQDERQRLEQAWQQTPDAVRVAIQQELQQTEAARQQYQTATWQAAQVSAAALFSNFPELTGLSGDQLAGAVSAISRTDPAKAQAINAHVQRTQALYKASIDAQQQQAQLQAAQLKSWAAAQDAEFERVVASKESPARMQEITQNVVELAQEYGVSKEELIAAWQSQPVLRTAAFQRMMVDAAKYRMAQKAVPAKVSRPVPPVQKPGVASSHRSDDGVDAAKRAFNKSPSPQSAAALLTARRAANRR